MVSANHDRSRHIAARYHLVESHSNSVPLLQSEPTNAGWQSLKSNMGARLVQPIVQEGIVGYDFANHLIGAIDIFGISRQRYPPERSFTNTEQRPHVGFDKSGIGERVFHAHFLRHCPDVVTVIKGDHTPAFECQNGANLLRHRALGCFGCTAGIALAMLNPLLDAPSERQIAIDRIVGRSLVRHYVGEHASIKNLLINFGGISDKSNRDRLAMLFRGFDNCEGLVKTCRAAVEVAGALAELDATRLTFDN